MYSEKPIEPLRKANMVKLFKYLAAVLFATPAIVAVSLTAVTSFDWGAKGRTFGIANDWLVCAVVLFVYLIACMTMLYQTNIKEKMEEFYGWNSQASYVISIFSVYSLASVFVYPIAGFLTVPVCLFIVGLADGKRFTGFIWGFLTFPVIVFSWLSLVFLFLGLSGIPMVSSMIATSHHHWKGFESNQENDEQRFFRYAKVYLPAVMVLALLKTVIFI